METIKKHLVGNFFLNDLQFLIRRRNVGKAQDDETPYGQGQTSGAHTGLAGEGSHLQSSSGQAPSALPGSFPTDNATSVQSNSGIGAGNTTTGTHTSNLADKVDPTVDDGERGTSLGGGQRSGLGGPNTIGSDTTSGFGNTQSSGIPSNTTSTGTTSGFGNTQSSGITSNTTARDTTSGFGNTQSSGITSNTTARDTTSGFGNTQSSGIPSNTTATGTTSGFGNTQSSGILSNTTATNTSTTSPHSSNLENKLDPRVQSQGTTGAGYGGQTTGLASGSTSSEQQGSNLGQSGSTFDDDVPRSASGGILNSQTSSTTAGTSGTANAGPHNSALLNRFGPKSRFWARYQDPGHHLIRSRSWDIRSWKHVIYRPN